MGLGIQRLLRKEELVGVNLPPWSPTPIPKACAPGDQKPLGLRLQPGRRGQGQALGGPGEDRCCFSRPSTHLADSWGLSEHMWVGSRNGAGSWPQSRVGRGRRPGALQEGGRPLSPLLPAPPAGRGASRPHHAHPGRSREQCRLQSGVRHRPGQGGSDLEAAPARQPRGSGLRRVRAAPVQGLGGSGLGQVGQHSSDSSSGMALDVRGQGRLFHHGHSVLWACKEYAGGTRKTRFIHEILCICSQTFEPQSPSKSSAFEAGHLSRRLFRGSRQCSNCPF